MIFPGFPGVLSFFQVFQVEWEPWKDKATIGRMGWILRESKFEAKVLTTLDPTYNE